MARVYKRTDKYKQNRATICIIMDYIYATTSLMSIISFHVSVPANSC